MSRNKNKKRKGAGGDGFIGRLFANTKLPAHVTEENDWYLDTPDVRLTRVFAIVLILHVVAVGGILAFKMIEKAAGPEVVGRSTEVTEVAAATVAAPAPAPSVEAPVAPPVVERPLHRQSVSQPAAEAPVIVDHPSLAGHSEYRVRASDSLAGIARSQGVSVAELRKLNNLDSGDKIYVGRWLVIPKNESAQSMPEPKKVVATKPAVVAEKLKPLTPKPMPAPAVAATPQPNATGNSYQVQAGDTFYAISKKFGVPYQDIMSANGIDSPQGLRSGMTLAIPVAQ